MNEQAIATLPREIDEYDDDDSLLELAAEDADEVADEYKVWFPTEYLVGILGHRGGGKSALLAHYGFNCLAAGCKVFTNLEMYPEKLGLTNKPFPLELDNILNFDTSLESAVLLIEEIGTWVERKRAMSTTSIIIDKFLQLVIRKKGLRIFFTNQSPLLPAGLAEQTDIVHQAFDVFFCDWARDYNIAKGTTFYYMTTDRTGIFGVPGRTWRVALRKANRLWGTFNTNQIFDPFQWARKTMIKGGEQIIDIDSGEAYNASEEGIRAWQHDVSAYSIALKKIISSYQSMGFMDMAERHDAVNELPDRYVFSVHQLHKGLTNLKGTKRKQAEDAYNELRTLANQGQLARFGPRLESIELAKPITQE